MDEKSIIEVTLCEYDKQKLIREFGDITYEPLGSEQYTRDL